MKNNKANFSILWLDIEDESSRTYWGTDVEKSKTFVKGLHDEAVKILGSGRVGVYTSANNWNVIFQSSSYNCCSGVKLWYAHYDNKQSFSDFSAFGGWSKPYMKQYAGDKTVCSVGVDLNYW